MLRNIKRFEKTIAMGFLLAIIASIAITVISFQSLRMVVNNNNSVVYDHAYDLLLIERLNLLIEQKVAHSRAYLITRDPKYLTETTERRNEFNIQVELIKTALKNPNTRRLLFEVIAAEKDHHENMWKLMRMPEQEIDVAGKFEQDVKPRRDRLKMAIGKLAEVKTAIYEASKSDASSASSAAAKWIIATGIAASLLGMALAILIFRTLGRIRALLEINHEEASRSRKLVESNNTGIVIANFEQGPTEVNQAFCIMVGRSKEEILSEPRIWQEELTPPEWKDLDEKFRQKLETSGMAVPYEKELIHASGHRVRVLVGGAIIDKDKGEYATFILNRTAAYKAELYNQHLMAKLEDAVKARDEFINVASHELKTPLTSLMLRSQLIAKDLQDPNAGNLSTDKIKAYNEQTLVHVHRLNQVVEHMLNVSKIRSGTLGLDLQQNNFKDIVLEAIQETKSIARVEKSDLCETTFTGDMTLICDRTLIKQIVVNLMSNAIKYGQGKPVRVSVTRSGNYLTLIITDQGLGFDRDLSEKIFLQYERAISSNEVSGLGLGLYISKEFTRAHDGKIWAESEPGKGASFYVELPANPHNISY